ncbi:hypothetical protein C9374_012948 [Naegleria lovaniensis]|uniref:Uncharacterized protein n=1 Tax=Naegleria lovaniensis TaxID=51637 RepID=A0AA88G6H5_NAELO|nr:uncharacterized protein C9374_012948 [Naegleria lovaniensis]KAG2373005.1 hypothetical protein C9374_012948 [Naegleria lovaniensis]
MSTLFKGSACFCPSLYWMITGEVEIEKEPFAAVQEDDLSHLLFSNEKALPSSSTRLHHQKRNDGKSHHDSSGDHENDISLSSTSALSFAEYSEGAQPKHNQLLRRELLVENTQEEQAVLIICNLQDETSIGKGWSSRKKDLHKNSSSKVIHRSQLAPGQVLYIPKSKVYVNAPQEQAQSNQSSIKYLVVASHVKLVPRKSAIFNFFENTLELRLAQYHQQKQLLDHAEEHATVTERFQHPTSMTYHRDVQQQQHDDHTPNKTLSSNSIEKKRKLVDTSVQCDNMYVQQHDTKRVTRTSPTLQLHRQQHSRSQAEDHKETLQHDTILSPTSPYNDNFELERRRIEVFKQKLKEIVKKHSSSNSCSIAQIQLPDRSSTKRKKKTTTTTSSSKASGKYMASVEKDAISEMSIASSVASCMSFSPNMLENISDLNKSFTLSNKSVQREKVSANLDEAFIVSDSQTGAYMEEAQISGDGTPSLCCGDDNSQTNMPQPATTSSKVCTEESKGISRLSRSPALLTPSPLIEVVRYNPVVATKEDLNMSSQIHETSLTHISDSVNTTIIFMDDSPVESKGAQISEVVARSPKSDKCLPGIIEQETVDSQKLMEHRSVMIRTSTGDTSTCEPMINVSSSASLIEAPSPIPSLLKVNSQPSQDDSGLLNAAQLLSSMKSPALAK